MSGWARDGHLFEVWGKLARSGKPRLLGSPRDEDAVRCLLNQYVRASHLYSRLTVYTAGRKRELEHIDLPYGGKK